jgi:hypothetical protein
VLRTLLLLAFSALVSSAALAAPPAEPKVTFKENGVYEVSEAFLDEMYCITGALKQRDLDDYGAMLVLSGDNPTAKAAAKAAFEECAKTYGWNDKEKGFADEIGQNDAIWQFQLLELSLIKIKPENLEAAWNALSNADRLHFRNDGWNNDAAFRERVNAALLANGVRNNPEILEKATIGLGAYTFVAVARERWVNHWKAAHP